MGTVNVVNGSSSALTPQGYPVISERRPEWSPDGSRIAFAARDSDVPSGQDAIYIMPVGGGAATNITNGLHIGTVESLDWQPLPRALAPANKAECKKGGHKELGFRKQGRCVAFVNRTAHNR